MVNCWETHTQKKINSLKTFFYGEGGGGEGEGEATTINKEGNVNIRFGNDVNNEKCLIRLIWVKTRISRSSMRKGSNRTISKYRTLIVLSLVIKKIQLIQAFVNLFCFFKTAISFIFFNF